MSKPSALQLPKALPKARKEGLLVETLPDEVLVYDLDLKKAHCLNRTATLIWEHCDGNRNANEIAHVLSHHLNTPIGEEVVWYGLRQLSKSRLLETEIIRPGKLPNATRRDLIRKIGLAASIPLVMSILAPRASAVNSGCTDRFCVTNGDCIPGCPTCNTLTMKCGL